MKEYLILWVPLLRLNFHILAFVANQERAKDMRKLGSKKTSMQ